MSNNDYVVCDPVSVRHGRLVLEPRRRFVICFLSLLATNLIWGVTWAVSNSDSYSYGKTLPDKGRVWTVIIRHLDVDTVQIGSIVDEGTARLLDIDAPELEPRLNLTEDEKREPAILAARRAEIEAEKKLARASAKRLAELLPVNSVWRTEVKGHEGFGRTLVRFIREDGKTINQQMLDEGHAKEYRR